MKETQADRQAHEHTFTQTDTNRHRHTQTDKDTGTQTHMHYAVTESGCLGKAAERKLKIEIT